jgi:putative ABC transport system permease protein
MLALRLALRQLWRFPWRSGLMLGCGGMSAALVMAALNYTAAGRAQFLAQLDAWGANTLIITPALSRSVGGRARTGAPVTTLRTADLAALRAAAPAISAAAEMATGAFLAKAGDLAKNNASIVGVSAGYFDLRQWLPAAGRDFTPAEAREAARLALLGAGVARDLFPGGAPTGRRIFINRVPFIVVGVLAARGQRLDATNQDDQIYVPLLTLRHRLLQRDYDSALFLTVSSSTLMSAVAEQATLLLRRRHHLAPAQPDDFQIQDQQTLLATRAAAARRLQQLVRTAGAGGLLAAGLALLALHLLALGARRRELAIRRALGATTAALLAQLAAEAGLLAVGIAALAAAAGWAFTRVAENWARLPPRFDLATATEVCLAAIVLDMLCALLPARRAARQAGF